MKKAILLAAALLALTAAKAQLTWEARLGAVVSKFTESDTKMKLGMKAGVGAQYAVSDLVAVRPGVYFTMKGASKDDSFAIGSGDSFNLSYLEIPVLASFRFPMTENFKLALSAGPYFGLRLNKPDGTEGLKTGDFGVNVGLDFIFGKAGKIVLGPEIEYGLTKVGADDDKNLAYMLCLGYKF
ncbi:MAG: PorT family protein [Rikenellaceae bacterium]|jgi:opacity protein-like surface antigen|nr:PorT family protein [Rikenellaceae bacterium]